LLHGRADRPRGEDFSKPAPSVTDVGLTVGFSEASSFAAAFRKATGLTPTTYHRSLT
jgi:AraC family transcriptional regulator